MEAINLLPAEYKLQISMVKEENRLASFKTWIFDDSCACNAAKMAEAGFYSVATDEEPDAVQCFLCSKILDGWEAEDDPWQEHASHASNCTFAKLQTPEDLLTVKQFIKLEEEQLINLISKYFDYRISQYRELFAELHSYKENTCK